MILNNLLSYIRKQKKIALFKRNATIIGSEHIFGNSANISIENGSIKEDVIIENNVWIHGDICSQNGGKIHLGKYTKIGYNTYIQCVNRIEIGDYTRIAINVYISDNNNHPISPIYRQYMAQMPENDDSRRWRHSANAPIIIGRNCWIGQNVRIQKGVTIGDNCVIAANSIVTKSIPANCIAGGNPAKVLKTDIDKIEPPTTCEGFNEWIAKQ